MATALWSFYFDSNGNKHQRLATEEMTMDAQQADQHGRAIPVTIALIVAVVGQAAILFNDFGPGNGSHRGGNPSMISAAAVSRAGATEVPSTPPIIQQALAAKTAT